jgi:hypothetical protein
MLTEQNVDEHPEICPASPGKIGMCSREWELRSTKLRWRIKELRKGENVY